MACCVIFGCEDNTTTCQKCGMPLCDEHEKLHVYTCPYHDTHMKGSNLYRLKHGEDDRYKNEETIL